PPSFPTRRSSDLPDDRAGHRLGDCWARARRYLLRLRRAGRPHRRAGEEPRALCHADAARARSGRSWQGDAAAGAAPEVCAEAGAHDGRDAGRLAAERADSAAARAAEIMTRRSRVLSDDERALWDAVTRAVAPLRRRKAKVKDSVAVEQAAAPLPMKPSRNAPKAAAPAPPPR